MDTNPEIEAFVVNALAGLSLEDEAIAEYFARLVEEESMEEPEKREAITELLADVTEEPTTTIIDEVFEFYNGLQAKKKAQEEEQKAKVLAAAKEKERASLLAELDRRDDNGILSMSSRHVVKNLTKEERRKREALLAQYGFDMDEIVEGDDGELEISYKDRSGSGGKKSSSGTSDPLLQANNNADIVKQKEAARRAEMRKASESERERNKQALEKQRLEKEKEKRRTQKHEKRRISIASTLNTPTQHGPTIALQFKADLENITDLVPADADHTWHFKLECSSCREVDDNWITLNAIDKSEQSSGRGEANLVMKCKFCKKENSCDFLTKPVAYTIENNGKYVSMITMDCRGMEPVAFEPREGWKAKGAETETVFEDIDLTDGDFADYDEKSELPVSISGIEAKFVKLK
ncbi:hypothetical protein DFQ27_000583 [Actinomortierella ambigua]|uniref:Uncharacterized protein n=1 Tax=Actinomortierella ambigua TaxID=1343610 RepID=A0A9P6QCQ9_9FUNG|nr:hypothetical protein DFQ27_000583 [Actinomortierella ambigua]